ncbi:hypothetical protein R6Q59_031301 [Mikania micrantha]
MNKGSSNLEGSSEFDRFMANLCISNEPNLLVKVRLTNKVRSVESSFILRFVHDKVRSSKVRSKDMVNLTFGDKHNVWAYLDPTTQNGQDFRPMIEFLRRSRIYYAISNSVQIYRSHIQSFWESARVISVDEDYVIDANVLGQAICISEADIRRVLQFGGEPNGVTLIPDRCIKGCFLRIRYFGAYNSI